MEGKNKEIVLYSEFMLPLSVRLMATVFSVVGIIAFTTNVLIGCVLTPIGILAWSFYVKAVFYPEEKILLAETLMFFFRVSGKPKKIEIDHISITRVILKSRYQLAPGKGVSGPSAQVSSMQYNVLLIFDKNKKETLYSVNDQKEAMEFAVKYAKDFGVKIFYAASTPQKWIDPVTGVETIVEFKRKKR